MIMDLKELYQRISGFQRHRTMLYNLIVSDTIDTVVRQGFVDPKCYVLEYNLATRVFSKTIFELDANELRNPTKNEALYGMLKNLQNHVPNKILAISMVSEGTFRIHDDKLKASYLLISFETHTESFLNAYRLVKRREIGPDGEVLKIMSMTKDDNFSRKRDNPEVEKFTHVIRPNLFVKNDEVLYN